MSIWFTSDTHFGHARIIELCNRPFKDVSHMNEMIIKWWNELVAPDDTVYHLGDVALGPIMDSLSCISRLNGEIVLVEGNHDRPFMAKSDEKRDEWVEKYLAAGFTAVYSSLTLVDRGPLEGPVNLSHFPYEGDSHDGDRFESIRLKDNGIVLLHGHTHSSGHPVSWSTKRKKDVPVYEDGKQVRDEKGKPVTRTQSVPTLQVHVGMDAWNYRPVSAEQIAEVIKAA